MPKTKVSPIQQRPPIPIIPIDDLLDDDLKPFDEREISLAFCCGQSQRLANAYIAYDKDRSEKNLALIAAAHNDYASCFQGFVDARPELFEHKEAV